MTKDKQNYHEYQFLIHSSFRDCENQTGRVLYAEVKVKTYIDQMNGAWMDILQMLCTYTRGTSIKQELSRRHKHLK